MKLTFFTSEISNGPIPRNNVKIFEFLQRQLGCGLICQFVAQTKQISADCDIFRKIELFDLDIFSRLDSIWKYFRYSKREKPEIVFAMTAWPAFVALLVRFLRRSNEYVIISNHTTISFWLREKSSPLEVFFMRVMMIASYRFANLVTSVSVESANDLETYCWLPKGSVLARFDPVYDDKILIGACEENDHDWLAAQKKVIVTAARLEPEKDLSTLLKAFQIVRQDTEVYLIILGDGSMLEKLQREAQELGVEEYVDFVGFQSNPFRFFSRASVFVLSSKFEGLGNVLIEALACNCPCVATNCFGGPKEILEYGRYGELVEVGDFNSMAAAIEKQLREPNRNGLQARASEYSVERTQAELLSKIQHWLGNRCSPLESKLADE